MELPHVTAPSTIHTQALILNCLFSVVLVIGGVYEYNQTKSALFLMAGMGFGILYGVCGYLIHHANYLLAYQISTIASLALALSMLVPAQRTRKGLPVSLVVIGVIGALDMGYCWYNFTRIA